VSGALTEGEVAECAALLRQVCSAAFVHEPAGKGGRRSAGLTRIGE